MKLNGALTLTPGVQPPLERPRRRSHRPLYCPAVTLSTRTLVALRELAAEAPVTVTVAGDCMTPTLRSGDRVRVIRAKVLWPGDIVTFQRADGRLLVHRMLGYTLGSHGLSLLARGDHLSREDEPVRLDRVVGRVIECEGSPLSTSMGQRWRCAVECLRTLLRRSVRSWVSAPSS